MQVSERMAPSAVKTCLIVLRSCCCTLVVSIPFLLACEFISMTRVLNKYLSRCTKVSLDRVLSAATSLHFEVYREADALDAGACR